jgi:hypothetical protein
MAWFWGIVVLVAVIMALFGIKGPQDQNTPVSNDTLTGNPCGANAQVVSTVLINDNNPIKLYNVTCQSPTNPGQPPAQWTMQVGQ